MKFAHKLKTTPNTCYHYVFEAIVGDMFNRPN